MMLLEQPLVPLPVLVLLLVLLPELPLLKNPPKASSSVKRKLPMVPLLELNNLQKPETAEKAHVPNV